MIWITTFLIGIVVLIFKNFNLEFFFEKRLKEQDKKKEVILITLLTLVMPFFLERVFLDINLDKNDIISLLKIIPTIVLAVIAYFGYGKIIVNKVNEEQLSQVLELIKKINDCKFTIYASLTRGSTVTGSNSLIELAKSSTLQEKSTALNQDYNHLFVNDTFLTSLLEISSYSTNILIPKEIAHELEPLVIKDHVKKEMKEITIDILQGDKISVKKQDEEVCKCKEPLYRYITIIQNGRNSGQGNTLPLSITYAYIFKAKESPYKSWNDLKKQLNILIRAIDKWLKNNNVRDINLPN